MKRPGIRTAIRKAYRYLKNRWFVFQHLRDFTRRFPWPVIDSSWKPFYWSLDAGGKDIVKQLLIDRDARVMIEIGVFMGGSSLQWLRAKDDVIVIGIDPWDFDGQAYFDRNIDTYIEGRQYDLYGSSKAKISAQLGAIDGFYLSALTNLREFRHRFVPVRGKSPDVLHLLKEYGVKPDVIYLDSNKALQEIDLLYELFPGVQICGDDWYWENTEGNRPVESFLNDYCERNKCRVEVDRMTWILHRDGELQPM